MSVEQYIAVDRAQVPSTSDLSVAASSLGFSLQFDEVDLLEHTGFLPATLNGHEAGFEWYLEPAADFEHFSVPQDHVVVVLRAGSSEIEGQAAMVCAAALMKCSGGVYFDDFEQTFRDPEDVAAQARDWIEGRT